MFCRGGWRRRIGKKTVAWIPEPGASLCVVCMFFLFTLPVRGFSPSTSASKGNAREADWEL